MNKITRKKYYGSFREQYYCIIKLKHNFRIGAYMRKRKRIFRRIKKLKGACIKGIIIDEFEAGEEK